MWWGMRMPVHTFESSQLEGSYVGNILYYFYILRMYADLSWSSKAVQYANVLENILWNKGQKKHKNVRVLWIIFFQYICLSSNSNRVNFSVQFSSVQSLSSSDSLQPHGLQHARPPCPSPTPRVYSNSCSLSQWCHPTISSSVVPFSSHLQSLPASGSFPMSQLLASGGQSNGVSASTSVFQWIFMTDFL